VISIVYAWKDRLGRTSLPLFSAKSCDTFKVRTIDRTFLTASHSSYKRSSLKDLDKLESPLVVPQHQKIRRLSIDIEESGTESMSELDEEAPYEKNHAVKDRIVFCGGRIALTLRECGIRGAVVQLVEPFSSALNVDLHYACASRRLDWSCLISLSSVRLFCSCGSQVPCLAIGSMLAVLFLGQSAGNSLDSNFSKRIGANSLLWRNNRPRNRRKVVHIGRNSNDGYLMV
jgi:hypothetical protein